MDLIGAVDVQGIRLARGEHDVAEGAACALEWVSVLAGEAFSAFPQTACPVVGALVRRFNDDLDGERRDALLAPLVPRLVGSADASLADARRTLLLDWLARMHAPAWLALDDDVRGLADAVTLRACAPIVNDATARDALPDLVRVAARVEARLEADAHLLWTAPITHRAGTFAATVAVVGGSGGVALAARAASVVAAGAACRAVVAAHARAVAAGFRWHDAWDEAAVALDAPIRAMQRGVVEVAARMLAIAPSRPAI